MTHDTHLGITADSGIREGEVGRNGLSLVVDNLHDGGILSFVQRGAEIEVLSCLI